MDNTETVGTLEKTEGAIKNGQYRLEILEKTEGAIKNGQYRDSGNIRENREGAIKNVQYRDIGNIRENRRGNQEWTIQRQWKY